MAADESSEPRAASIVLRIKLRYDNVDTLVERFAPNVGKSGLFLPTRSLRPIGSEVRFELRLANDVAALVGLGKVRAVREPDPANPKAAFGMAIELLRVTRDSRALILRMLERRRALGLGETALPIPADLEASRRSEVESTSVRGIAAISRAESPPDARTATTAVGSGQLPPDDPPADEPLLSAPRPRRSSIGIAREPAGATFAIAPLASEPPRARRPRLSEVMAAGRTAGREAAAAQIREPLEGEDAVDVAGALARARVLATGEVDGELAQLREVAAAPVEITVEAASAELARQLGGRAVAVRERNARWAPPPAVVTPPPAPVAAPAPVFDSPEFHDEIDTPLPRIVEPPEDDLPAPIARLDDDEPSAQHTQIAPAPFAEATHSHLMVAPVPDTDEDDDVEEVDDLEIIAEADADDADLLMSDGEADASGPTAASSAAMTGVMLPVPVPVGRVRAGTFDFAAALDLGDDDSFDRELPVATPRELDARPRPGGHRDAATSSTGLTGAAAAAPALDLESALDSLDSHDVDLAGLGITPAPTLTSPTVRELADRGVRPGRLPRAASEDGIVINFDDDDDDG